jgi:hypothetical protein
LPGTFVARTSFLGTAACLAESQRFRQGRVFGPYFELRDERLLAAIVGTNSDGTLQLAFPGDSNYDDALPKTIVDYWGQPIRYYRLPHLPGNPAQVYRKGMPGKGYIPLERTPTLADVFLLRPYRVPPGQELDGIADGAGDTTITQSLQSASFGLFSSGPDRRLTQDRRVDTDQEYNRDNIVELGR